MYRKILNWLNKQSDSWINRLIAFKRFVAYQIYMDDFGYRKSDIYIVTYPRSGTTLLQMMLYQITTDGNCDFEHLYDISPWLRNDVYEGIAANKELKDPRIIKTHDAYKDFDKLIDGKIIFVIRDGLDAMYSLYRQKVDYGNPLLTIEQFSKDLFQDNRKNWIKFNGPWLENKQNKPVLYLTYNQLVSDKENTIKKICEFIEWDYKKVDVSRVVEKTSYAFMKEHEALFGERVSEDHKNYDYTKFIRNGKSGEGQEGFSEEIKEKYQKYFKKFIEPLLEKRSLKL